MSEQMELNDKEIPKPLVAENENLKNTIENEEKELPPPEAEMESAKQFNTGAALGAIMLFVVFAVLFISVISMTKQKKKSEEREMPSAGTKFIPKFDYIEEPKKTEIRRENQGKNENVDEILETLPPELKEQPEPTPTPAPVGRVGGGEGGKYYERPDTRNSNSIRKIEGIKGQDYSKQNSNNMEIIASAMNGAYPAGSGPNGRMTKEEYIAQQMKQTQTLQNQLYGVQNSSPSNYFQDNRENFFGTNLNNAGSGQYMSYASLWDGTIISGALITAINTDNPGVVIARVTENVYSSYDSSFLLIPEGSLLYATYNSSVSYGQNKVQVAWNLLIRPDGYRMQLGNMNGVNTQGVSGYKGNVNNHPFQTLKALGLVAIYSLINTDVNETLSKTTNNRYAENAMSDVYKEGQKIGNKIIDRALDIKPTITIRQGTEIKLITNTPLELPPVKVNKVTRKYLRG